MANSPLRPEEHDTYRTEIDTDELDEPPSGTPAADARPWTMVGLVLLGAFVVGLILAIAMAMP